MLISEKIQRKKDLKEFTDEAEQIEDKLIILKDEQRRFGRTIERDKQIRNLQYRKDYLTRIIRCRAGAIGIINLKGETLC